MHEFSICEGLVNAVLAELDNQPPGSRLRKTSIVVGDMRQIVPDTLRFAYETLTRDTRAANSKLEITRIPITIHCRACNSEAEIEDQLFVCKSCGAADVDIVTGKELHLASLEIEEPDEE